MTQRQKVKIAAIGDIHVKEGVSHTELFSEIQEKADILVLCGDLTDHGTPEQSHLLIQETSQVRIPILAVLGNHDHESGVQDEVKRILKEGKIILLEDEEYEYQDVGFAGVKGFAGGFDKYTLGQFGETAIKDFVQESVNEALKLESSLLRLTTPYKVVALHYSPIRATCEGEPPEIFPFLGSSRLAEPIDRYEATVVFHGHADLGTLEGATEKGVSVYNVDLPLLKKHFPKHPYKIVEV